MKTKQEIETGLNQWTGTEAYHQVSIFKNVVMTDGVKWLCDNAECYWLIDAIASHQPDALKHKALKQAQFWTFKVTGSKIGGPATLTCETGRRGAKPVITQNFASTTFPLPTIRLYCMPGINRQVILLPSEY